MTASSKQDRRAIRRLAMQALYQLDITNHEELPTAEALAQTLDDEHDGTDARQRAAGIALTAWAQRQAHDELATTLAPDWPTHRQPPVDRAILRLACHEIAAGLTPPKVAINEAVELAKQFAAEQSPAFINGVLDKAAKRLAPAEGSTPTTGDAWLDDAMAGDESAAD